MDEKTKHKEVIIFDLDETLTESKSSLDSEMAALLRNLLQRMKVAVTSGGRFEQFEKQFLGNLDADKEMLKNLYLMPTSASELYFYDGGWNKVYSISLTEKEKQDITEAFKSVLEKTGFETPEKVYGEQIEDRGAQITYSHFGQEAPPTLKKEWDPDHKKREKIRSILLDILPEFQIQIGGSTSIDVTRKGMDKGYGLMELAKYLEVDISKMLFVGDDLSEGGNDFPVQKTGVDWIEVLGPEETKGVVRDLLKK